MWIFSGFWFLCVCFLFFLVFSEKVIYYGFPECTKLLSCAYYVGGSFYMILCVLYKNWGVLNILVFFNVSCFFIIYGCLFRCVRLLCSYTLHLKLYFKGALVCFEAYSTPYKCRLNLHHFSC